MLDQDDDAGGITALIPVSEWQWWLWRVRLTGALGLTRTLWMVSTDTHLEAELDCCWPSDSFTEWTAEAMAAATEPRQLWCSALRRAYPESARTAGERLRDAWGMNDHTPPIGAPAEETD